VRSLRLLSTPIHLFLFGLAPASTLCPARSTFSHNDLTCPRDSRKRTDPGDKAVPRRTARWIGVIKLPINGASRNVSGLEPGGVGRAWVLLGIQERTIGAGEQQLHAHLKVLAREISLLLPVVCERKRHQRGATRHAAHRLTQLPIDRVVVAI